MLDEPNGSLAVHPSRKRERETSGFNQYDAILSCSSFEWLVVTGAVLFVEIWIIEQRRWRISTRSQMAHYFIVIPQQRIDQGDQSARDMTDGLPFPFVRLRAFVVGT